MPEGKKPLEMELLALKNSIEEKLTRLRVRAFGNRPELGIRELRPALNLFNIYGRIVFKKRKGCAHYYKFLNNSRMKYDCWSNAWLTYENDQHFMYDDAMYNKIIS